MSLARIALRMAAVQALKDRTEVGANVLDSEIGALDMAADGSLRTNRQKPFVAVYTDAATVEGTDQELRSLTQNGMTELVFEMGIASSMLERDPETGDSQVMVDIPATDRTLEYTLDLVGRQIADALTDPDSTWGEIVRGLTFRFAKVERTRTSNNRDGVKLAGQQIRITLELIEDPMRGEAIAADTPFARFFDAMNDLGDTVIAAQVARMQAELEGANEPWELVQRRMGMTRAELLALGLGPLEGDEDRETPELDEGEIEVEGLDPVTVTEND